MKLPARTAFALLVMTGALSHHLPAQATVDQPAVVNDSLGLDYSVLDSAEVWTEEPDDQGNRHLVVVSYHVGRDSVGPPTLERLVTDRARPATGGAERFIDRWRSGLRLGGDPQIAESFQRTAFGPGTVSASFTLSVAGGHFQLSSATRQNGGPVPVGVLTPRLLGAAIAALPDSLPDQAVIWILDSNTGLANPQTVSFGPFEVAWLPVAQGQDECAEGQRPVPAPMSVRWATATFGSRQVRFPVLAARPHLRVDAATLRCLWLPSRNSTPS
jgi:hypothetical protein